MKIKHVLAGAASVAVIATAAYASVTFDPATGFGFVGKGDVQLAFNWNNKAAQDNANAVVFTYENESSYDIVCEWETVTNPKNSQVIPHIVTTHKTTSINSSVAYEARQKNQYTGYNLLGTGPSTVTGGPVPNVGDGCIGGAVGAGHPGLITEVTLSPDSSLLGTLFVTFNGNKQPLGAY